MKLKKILKSPVFISIATSIILIVGLVIMCTPKDEPNENLNIIEEDIIEIIPYSNYDWDYLTGEERLKYDDDNYTSMFGIDVATFQGTIDWKKVKEDGVEFVFIRLGYRGAIEGILHTDDQFEANYKGAIENGIKVGVYWYCQPADEKEAIEEADYVLDVLNNRYIDFPIVCDFEETEFYDGSVSRLQGYSKSQYTSLAKAFCEEIEKHHQKVIIYSFPYWIDNCFNMEELSEYPLWYASYTKNPSSELPIVMWQYTNEGHIDGINTDVDLNLLFIQKSDQN